MYGEDSSGRKVSLLNDDPSSSSRTTNYTTTNPHTITTSLSPSSSLTSSSSSSSTSSSSFTRPKLPDRSRFSNNSSSSACSSRSRDSYRSSRPSSVSCSPRRSPPTPPLVRLDSQSSTGTIPSPMTPSFQYDPMDPRNFYKTAPTAQQGFFVNSYPPPHAAGGTNPYPAVADPVSQSMFAMAVPQTLHSVYDLNDSFAHQASIHPAQAAALAQYSPNPALTQVSPTQNASLLPSATTMMPTTINTKPSNPHRDSNASSASSTNPSTYASSGMSPIKTDPSTPITTNSSSAKSSNSNATQPKKKYPCPHAKSAGCKDTFTTSGHAARHGKKHTGEKNVACPTCGKTFTRKDNMKQHERTHKSSQAANTASTRSASNSIHASPVLSSGSLNKRARAGPGNTMGVSPSLKELGGPELMMMDVPMDTQQALMAGLGRPEMRRSKLSEILEQVKQQDSELDADGELDVDADGESPALDALATVAAGEIVQ